MIWPFRKKEALVITEEYKTRAKQLDALLWAEEQGFDIFEEGIFSFSVPSDIETKDVYTVDDLEALFKCKRQKAMNIMKFMWQTKYATQLGKQYYVSRDRLYDFMNDNAGKQIYI